MKIAKLYFKNNITANLALILVTIASGLLAFVTADLVKVIFNDGILGNNLAVFEKNIILSIFLYIILFVINVATAVLENYTQWVATKNFRVGSVNNLLKTDYTYFLKNSPVSIWTDLTMSTMQVSTYYFTLVGLLPRIIQFSIYALIIFNINFYAGIFSMCTIPLIFLTTTGVQKKLSYWQDRFLQDSKELSQISVDTLSEASNIKVKNEWNFFLSKMEKQHTQLNHTVVKFVFFQNYWELIMTL